MTTETCPHCGAKLDAAQNGGDLVGYDCGTLFDTDEGVTFERSDDCYERQLAQKDAEIERLRDFLKMMTVTCEQKGKR